MTPGSHLSALRAKRSAAFFSVSHGACARSKEVHNLTNRSLRIAITMEGGRSNQQFPPSITKSPR
jgi:hypothetical protein